jgi:hypothetical protein
VLDSLSKVPTSEGDSWLRSQRSGSRLAESTDSRLARGISLISELLTFSFKFNNYSDPVSNWTRFMRLNEYSS